MGTHYYVCVCFTHSHTISLYIEMYYSILGEYCAAGRNTYTYTLMCLCCTNDSYRNGHIVDVERKRTVNETNTNTMATIQRTSPYHFLYSVSIHIMNTYLFHLGTHCIYFVLENRRLWTNTKSGDKFYRRNCYSISIELFGRIMCECFFTFLLYYSFL